jgi:hypothetical protein
VLLIIAGIFGLIGYLIGRPKRHAVGVCFLGFLLSATGIVVISLAKPAEEERTRKAMERMRAEQEAQRRLAAERVG